MTRVMLAGLALAAGLASTPAFAAQPDAPIATDARAADPTGSQIDAWIAADAAASESLTADTAPFGPVGPLERRIHGEVGASVSNRGYGGYAAVQMPVGQASEVDVAVAGEHVDRYGPFRGGDSKSLMIAVQLDGGDVARLISRDKCNVPRWGVKLKHDPVVLPDGRCVKPDVDKTAVAGAPRGGRGRADGSGLSRDPF